MKKVDLGEPTSFPDDVYLECTSTGVRNKQRNCRQFPNPGSPQELHKIYVVRGDLMQTSQHGSVMWKVMQRNAWSGIAK